MEWNELEWARTESRRAAEEGCGLGCWIRGVARGCKSGRVG